MAKKHARRTGNPPASKLKKPLDGAPSTVKWRSAVAQELSKDRKAAQAKRTKRKTKKAMRAASGQSKSRRKGYSVS